MKHLLKLSALVAIAVAASTVASADTLTLGSYASTSPNPGFSNTPVYFAPNQPAPPAGAVSPTGIMPGVANPTYALGNDGTWTAALTANGKQSQYVSLDPYTGPSNGGHAQVSEPNGAYGYHSYFSAAGDTAYTTGSLTILADDTVDAYLNGNQIVFNSQSSSNTYAKCSDTAPNCTTPLTVFLPTADFNTTGLNDLYFVVYQDASYATGLDFVGSVSQTPEPSSLLLLGTGLLGTAGTLVRRMRA